MILDVYSITDFIQVITQLQNLYDISVCLQCNHVTVTCSTLTVLIIYIQKLLDSDWLKMSATLILCNTGAKYETRVQNCVTPVQITNGL